MASMKSIAIVSGGVVAVVGVIVAMNVVAGDQDTATFDGGVSAQALPRQLPESNADPFQVISDTEEAARRATSNRNVAEEEIARSEGALQSYTAPPVIQLQGTSGDRSDPMADAFVTDSRKPAAEPLAKIEPVRPPNVAYKVPVQEVEASTNATPPVTGSPDQWVDDLLRRSMMQGRQSQGISINTYSGSGAGNRVPMNILEFEEGSAGGNTGLPTSRLPDVVQPLSQDTTRAAPVVALPEDPQGNADAAATDATEVLRTIDPNNPSSYVDGALDIDLGFDHFAAVTREHDQAYDWRKPYQVAQTALDGNSSLYDTSRNAQGFGSQTLLVPGDQRYATLVYGFNSDDAAQLPVFAQLHDYGADSSAFLNGARVRGTLRLAAESAVMEFDTLILQDGRTVPISAMGISADQLRVGVFDKVDRHVFERYSSLFVSGLIKGIGDVGNRVVDNRFGGNGDRNVIIIGDGTTNDNSRDRFTDDDWAVIGMGALSPIGDAMASNAARGFNRPPTVSAPPQHGFSIVFLDGLTFSQVQ
ncbi:TrbI/VirB10 family protein [uncultured Tateyamaria sp.]|uniref:DotG/IcmE/VirB10 family protein n=1 Tax=uncultured Tateyamaria sp. TaxID=455651 RepID=UPI0026106171|nr:TrbI/VirB10 family protein [uncultured Tateyamaria sp.]